MEQQQHFRIKEESEAQLPTHHGSKAFFITLVITGLDWPRYVGIRATSRCVALIFVKKTPVDQQLKKKMSDNFQKKTRE